MDGAEVALARQFGTHPLGRPHLDVGTDPAQPLDIGPHLVRIVGLMHAQPARHRIDPRQAVVGDGGAHIVNASLRQRPKLLGVIEADALDHGIDALGEARQHKAGVATRGRRGDAAAFEHGDRPALSRNLEGRGQTGQSSPDHADIDIEVEAEPRMMRPRHLRRLIPGRRRRLGSGIGIGHPLRSRVAAPCHRFGLLPVRTGAAKG
jgi:hypothetical protein